MRLAIILALLAQSAYATSYTIAATGNWNVAATWSPAAVPGAGDTISCPNSSPFVVTVSDAEIIGASGGNGTTAMNLSQNCTIAITSTGYLKVRGDVYLAGSYNNYYPGTWLTMVGGSIWEWDSSQASSPLTVKYHSYYDVYDGLKAMTVTGTPSSHAIIRSNIGGGNGYFGSTASINGNYNLQYATISYIGDATNPAFAAGTDAASHYNFYPWVAIANTFDHCGIAPFSSYSLSGEDIFQHDYNTYTNTLGAVSIERSGSASDLHYLCTGVNTPTAGCLTAGVREMNGNVFDKRMSTGWVADSFTALGNYFGEGYSTLATTHGISAWKYFKDNFFRASTTVYESRFNPDLMGDATDNLFFLDEAVSINPHGPAATTGSFNGTANGSAAQTFSWNIVDHAGKISAQISALYQVLNELDGSTNPNTMSYCILTPNVEWEPSWWMGVALQSQGHTASLQTITFNHNTWILDGTNQDVGVIAGHATTTTFLHELVFTNNIVWAPAGAPLTYKVATNITPTTDTCSITTCDYNAGFGQKTDGGGQTNGNHGYAMPFSTAGVGSHDIDGLDPLFIDPTRNVATFDSAYLGNTAAAWNQGGSYSVGDMVSSTDSTVYPAPGHSGGLLVNYRYVNAPGCYGTNPKPGQPQGVVTATNGSPTVTWVSGPQFDASWAGSGYGTTINIGPTGANYNTCAGSGIGTGQCGISTVSNCTGSLCKTITLTNNFSGTTGNQNFDTIAQPLQSRACWEWASLYRVRQWIASQTSASPMPLFDDQTIGAHSVGINTALMQWIRTGFAPTSPAYALAGSDGSDIGAVPVSFPPPIYPTFNPSVFYLQGIFKGIIR